MMMKSIATALAGSAMTLLSACATSSPPPAYEPQPQMAHVKRADSCNDCGTVAAVEPIEKKGSATGAGAVIGAVVGAVVGHQFGQGNGRDVGSAAGAVAGGIAGHEAEKRHNETTAYYKLDVNMDEGYSRTVNIASAEGIGVGTRVRLVGNDVQLLNTY